MQEGAPLPMPSTGLTMEGKHLILLVLLVLTPFMLHSLGKQCKGSKLAVVLLFKSDSSIPLLCHNTLVLL